MEVNQIHTSSFDEKTNGLAGRSRDKVLESSGSDMRQRKMEGHAHKKSQLPTQKIGICGLLSTSGN
jgi:hypothetical protein